MEVVGSDSEFPSWLDLLLPAQTATIFILVRGSPVMGYIRYVYIYTYIQSPNTSPKAMRKWHLSLFRDSNVIFVYFLRHVLEVVNEGNQVH